MKNETDSKFNFRERIRKRAIDELATHDQIVRGLERKRNWKNDSRRTNMGKKLVDKANK
jgi:hypothetical protein